MDETSNREAAMRYLRTVSALEAVQAARRLEYSLLGIQEGHHVLDVGCGLGDHARALAEQVGSGGKVIGIDSSEAMIAEARSRAGDSGLPVEYRLGDAHRLEFGDGTFDGCRASRVFHYLEAPRKALSEMIRVTRSEGTVVIAEPETDTFVIDAPDRNLTRKIMHFWCDTFRNGWIARQLPGLFQEFGLREVTVTPFAANIPFAVLDQFGLRKTVERAAKVGVISAEDADDWWNHLEKADREGRFFCATLTLYVSGRKP